MAVGGSRKRSANVGHHQYGRLVVLDDGTTAFQPLTGIADDQGNFAAVQHGGLVISSDAIDTMQQTLDDINFNLRLLLEITKGLS